MFRRSGGRALTAWVAALVVLIGSLAPVVSHAVHRGIEDGWAEICSVGGSKWVKVDPSSSAPEPDRAPHHLLEHCPYCSLHHAGLGMPPAALTFAAAPALPVALVVAHCERGESLTWADGQPRGPPAFDDCA